MTCTNKLILITFVTFDSGQMMNAMVLVLCRYLKDVAQTPKSRPFPALDIFLFVRVLGVANSTFYCNVAKRGMMMGVPDPWHAVIHEVCKENPMFKLHQTSAYNSCSTGSNCRLIDQHPFL